MTNPIKKYRIKRASKALVVAFREEPSCPSPERIKALLDKCPESVKAKTECQERLPLHWACYKKNVSIKLLDYLVTLYPEALQTPQHCKYLPLHIACQVGQPLEVIEFLWRKYPRAIETKAANDYLPLHVACEAGARLELIEWLIEKYPDAVKKLTAQDGMGKTPLHVASEKNAPLDVVRFLVDKYPFALNARCVENRHTPLHRACCDAHKRAGSRHDFSNIEKVLCTPLGLRSKTQGGFLPLHCAVIHRAPLELIQFLVEQDPYALCDKNNMHHWLPLDAAEASCKGKIDWKVVEFLKHQDLNTLLSKQRPGADSPDFENYTGEIVPPQRRGGGHHKSSGGYSASGNHHFYGGGGGGDGGGGGGCDSGGGCDGGGGC